MFFSLLSASGVSLLFSLLIWQGSAQSGRMVQPVECTLVLIEPLMVNVTDGEITTTICVMDPAHEPDGIKGVAYEVDVDAFDYGILKNVEYGETTLIISAAELERKPNHGGGTIKRPMPNASVEKRKNPGGGRGGGGLRGADIPFDRHERRLAQKMGNSTLIVLYAVPLVGPTNDDRTSEELANEIFGIGDPVDPVNARSQVLACSKGQLNYIPAEGNSTLIVNGVMEVPIADDVTGVASGTVVNWVTAQAQAMGVDIFGYTQIMVVIPSEADWGGAAAWAYLPGQLSAFQDTYSYRMGVQVHEFGHNIALHHSGYNGAAYADHSCLMGSPSYGDDGPQVCWNAAKSWESGWYAADSMTVTPTTAGEAIKLVGVADWTNDVYTPGVHKVVLEILDSSNSQNYYVIYNRAKGPNVGVNFAKDEVTVSTGADRQVSWHQAGLAAPAVGQQSLFPSFRKPNYNGSSQDLVVKVCDITLGTEGVTPDLADLLIYLDDGAALNNGPMCPGEFACLADSDCNDGNWCTQSTCDLSTNKCNPPVDISDQQCPTCGALTYCNPAGYCDDVCDDKRECTADSCVAGVCQHIDLEGCTIPGARLETWLAIAGNAVSDLTGSLAYQNNPPDEVIIIEDPLQTPSGRAENFGARLRTYIVPIISGRYTFYVASDDSSELWLSTDDTEANKVLIASVNGWTSPMQWTKYPTQTSPDILMAAGTTYFLEALYKEGGGGDHLAVAWESTDASIPLTVIGGPNFFVEPPNPCRSNDVCAGFLTNPCNTASCNPDRNICEFDYVANCVNGAKLETWDGISGTSIASLTGDSRYPNSPDTTTTLTTLLEGPTDRADNYGSRLQTYIMPPVTGDYNFYIATDDAGDLNLSTDTNPANKVRIAYVDGWTNSREWFKYASQKSAPISLVKGQIYYLEALMKEGGGGDNLAIAWESPANDIPLGLIEASHTSVALAMASPTPAPTPTLTNAPVDPTPQPTIDSTSEPTLSPTPGPTLAPTEEPTADPTPNPTAKPTLMPTNQPTDQPTDSPTPGPTNSPTNAPTTSPPTPITPPPSPSSTVDGPCTEMEFVVRVLTDNYPSEISWSIKNDCNGLIVATSPSYSSNGAEYVSDPIVLPSAQYTFEILDSAGDGICCGYGQGSYSVELDGTEVKSGGEFGASESDTWGSCDNSCEPPSTPQPTPTPGPVAAYDAALRAPACASIGSSCTTGDGLIKAKFGMSGQSEPNSSNTIDDCSDGTSGQYGIDESIEKLTVTNLSGGNIVVGDTVKVEALVQPWVDVPSADTADFYFAEDASNPLWFLIGSVAAGGTGETVTLSVEYTIPEGAFQQAVRVNFRYQGDASPCSSGSYDERDDLVFAVDSVSESFAVDSASESGRVSGVVAPKPVLPPKETKIECADLGEDRCIDKCAWKVRGKTGGVCSENKKDRDSIN